MYNVYTMLIFLIAIEIDQFVIFSVLIGYWNIKWIDKCLLCMLYYQLKVTLGTMEVIFSNILIHFTFGKLFT